MNTERGEGEKQPMGIEKELNLATLVRFLIEKLQEMVGKQNSVDWTRALGGVPLPNDPRTRAEYNSITVDRAVAQMLRWLEEEREETREGGKVQVPWVSDQELALYRRQLEQALADVIDPKEGGKPAISNLPDYKAIAAVAERLK